MPGSETNGALTQEHRHALAQAYRAGYYEIPRRTNLRRLARTVGIPPASLSRLLREAERALAESFLTAHRRP